MVTPLAGTAEQAFVHPALFYQGPWEYLAGTVPFIMEGLAAGAPVAVAVPEPRLGLLREALGEHAERIQLLDMGVAGRNPGRIIAEVLRATADAHPDEHVRIIGEPIWPGRSDTEYPACAQHEALINLAFTGRRVSILCPYDVAGLDPLVVADAASDSPGPHPARNDLVEPGLRARAHHRPVQPAAVGTRPSDERRVRCWWPPPCAPVDHRLRPGRRTGRRPG